jgi:hypothetical protein
MKPMRIGSAAHATLASSATSKAARMTVEDQLSLRRTQLGTISLGGSGAIESRSRWHLGAGLFRLREQGQRAVAECRGHSLEIDLGNRLQSMREGAS